MTQRSWAAFAMRVAERDMDSLAGIFDATKKLYAKVI